MLFQGRFDARTAVVTGGASGIGFAVAERLVREGARVSIWDRDATLVDAARTSLSDVHAVVLDVSDFEAVSAAAKDTVVRARWHRRPCHERGRHGPQHVYVGVFT